MITRLAVVGATLAAALALQPAHAADPKLPDTMAWSAYDVGSGGYNQAVAIGSALKNKYGVNLRVIPGKNDVSRMLPLKTKKLDFVANGVVEPLDISGIADGFSEVAVKLPAPPEAPASAASTVDEDPAALARAALPTGAALLTLPSRAGPGSRTTSAVSRASAVSLVTATGLPRRHSARCGVVSTQAGSRTSRSREAQSPPKAPRRVE